MPVEIKCKACGDSGWVSADGGVKRCACWQDRLRKWALGCPAEFQSATLANYKPLDGAKRALSLAKSFAAGTGDLYLYGPVGSGKSRLAASIANDIHHAGGQAFFVRVPRLLSQLQAPSSDEQKETAAQLQHQLFTQPIVVLDDLGAERERGSDYTRRTLLEIYEERGDRGHRTIWTSNLPLAPDPQDGAKRPPTVTEFMGDDRLASRIVGRSDIARITAPDQRLEAHIARRTTRQRPQGLTP